MQQNYCYQCCLADICKHIDRGTHTLASPACDAFDQGMRWIPVAERLPGYEQNVLLCVREVETYGSCHELKETYQSIYTGYCDDGEWYTVWCHGCRKTSKENEKYPMCEHTVTHWMPLPDAPEEDADA